MPSFTCPICDIDNDVEGGDLPQRSCDEVEHICEGCGTAMNIGWVPELEVRSIDGEEDS